MGKFQYIVVQENPAPQAQGRKMSLGTAQIPASLEAALYAVWPPPPPPPPPAHPPGTVLVARGDKLRERVGQLKAGGTLLLERGGTWAEPLALSSGHDGVTIGNFGDGPLPRIVAQFGLMLYGPSDGLHVSGLYLQGSKGTDGYGIQALTAGIRNATFTGNVIQGFRMNLMFQHPSGAARAPRNEWHTNITVNNNLILDAVRASAYDGHGMYMETVDGLFVAENLIDGCGMNLKMPDGGPNFSQYTHGMYIQAGNKRVNVVRNVVSRCESYGIQTRGPDINRPGEDTSDPGAAVRDNVLLDCAIGFTVDAGTRGTATGNYFVPGHFHTPQYHHGQGCGVVHCGGGDFSGNVRLDGPPPDPMKQDWRMPFMDLSVDGTDPDHPWRWKAPVSGNTVGRDYIGKGVFYDGSARIATLRAAATQAWAVGPFRDQIAADIEQAINRVFPPGPTPA